MKANVIGEKSWTETEGRIFLFTGEPNPIKIRNSKWVAHFQLGHPSSASCLLGTGQGLPQSDRFDSSRWEGERDVSEIGNIISTNTPTHRSGWCASIRLVVPKLNHFDYSSPLCPQTSFLPSFLLWPLLSFPHLSCHHLLSSWVF